ncbi:MAG TPA: GntR family transcriptional regulator [Actinobacteria bacterium]|nr:GntR family transcriptional regulator [Actinomycetota bacterium]
MDLVLDKRSYRPLYLQLTDYLADRIHSGEFPTGSRVPSERELAESLNVSRTTARLAVDQLVHTGVVYREQGRGTFVAAPRMRGVQGFTSFSEDVRSRGCEPGSQVIRFGPHSPNLEIRSKLRIGPDDLALELVRLRTADGEPVALQESYLPRDLAPGLEDHDMTDVSLFKVLRERYFVYPAWTEAEVKAMLASPGTCELLGIEPTDPVLVVDGLTFTDSFTIVEAVRTTYRSRDFALYLGRQPLDEPRLEQAQ